jgi:hypothetical protein
MLCVLPLLSLTLTSVWSLGPLCSIFFVSIGCWVGLRYFLFRDEICDQSSYRLYNVCILSCCLFCDLTFVVPCRYGSWAFISCLRMDVFLCWHGSFALLHRDHGFWWSLGVYPWLGRSRIDCTSDTSNHFGFWCFPLLTILYMSLNFSY